MEEWTVKWRVERDAEITHGDPPTYKFRNKSVYYASPIVFGGGWDMFVGVLTQEEAEAMAKLLNASQT